MGKSLTRSNLCSRRQRPDGRPFAILVTDRTLLPAWSGNRLRILGVIRALRDLGWRVVLIGANLGSLPELRRRVDALVPVAARSFGGGPLTAFDAQPFREAVEHAAADFQPRVAIAEYAWLVPALATLPKSVDRWVDCHDVLHERTERFRAVGLNPWTVCTRAEEVALLAGADTLLTCQQRDAELWRAILPGKRVACWFTQIDLPAHYARVPVEGVTVLAVGALHAGNDGIREFACFAWPRVLARFPHARLRVVGGIGAALPAVPGVDILGQVADLHAHYASAAVVVCPVTTGTGVKTKMLEALRLGKAVVVTKLAEEGLPLPPSRTWITADSLAECAESVANLLEDPAERAAIELRAFAYGERYVSEAAFREEVRALLPNVSDNLVGCVSIVIPHAGSRGQLWACLRLLQAQSAANAILEIIVVGDFPRGFRKRFEFNFPRVTFVQFAKPSAAAARNHGAALTRGDCIVFLDSDCRPRREWLAKMMAQSRQRGRYCVVVGHVRPGLRHSGAMGVQFHELLTAGSKRLCSSRSLLVPRQLWWCVGGFLDDPENAPFADKEWLDRAASRSAQVAQAGQADVIHPVHRSWFGLRAKARRLAASEWRQSYGGLGGKPFWSLCFATTRRLRQEIAAVFWHSNIPRRSRPATAVAAVLVWAWRVAELRRRTSASARGSAVAEALTAALAFRPLSVAAPPPLGSVSVIVPCAGWPPTLQACLQSLQGQQVDIPMQIVVVINGPLPKEGLPSQRGVCFVHEPRPGPAAARNAGVRIATGDIVALIDSDCIAAPTWLTAAIGRMRHDSVECIVAGSISRSLATRNWIGVYDSVNYLQQERYVTGSGACVTANLVAHRSIFARVGDFDETFDEAAFEDWDWTLRAQAAGVPIVFEPGAVVDHPCMSRPAELRRKAERLARGQLLMQRKTGQLGESLELVPAVCRQARRAFRNHQVGWTDRVRLALAGVAVGFWMWRAARRARRLRPTELWR